MKTKALALCLFAWLAIGAKDCTGWGWGSSGNEGYAKNNPTSACHAKCNDAYAGCLRDCEK
jgi:hypothetical protein